MFDHMQSKEEKHFIYNHLSFTVKYHTDTVTEAARIVGFEIKPFRYSYLYEACGLIMMLFYFPFCRKIFGPVLTLSYLDISSVKHTYEGEWNDKNRLTTCDPHAKRAVTNSDTPQEVEDKKEIIFTYDVNFEVRPLQTFMKLHYA